MSALEAKEYGLIDEVLESGSAAAAIGEREAVGVRENS
jgi:ATP-dependent protease ClpP protease subunit